MVNVSRTKPVMTLALLGIGVGFAYFAYKQGWIDDLLGREKEDEEDDKELPNEDEMEDLIADLEDEMGGPKKGPQLPVLPESGISRNDMGGSGIMSYQNPPIPSTFTGGYPNAVPTGAGMFPASSFYDPNFLSLMYNAQNHQLEQQGAVVDYFDPTTNPTPPNPVPAPVPPQAAFARAYMGSRNFRHRRFGHIKDMAYKMDYDRGYIIKNSENKPPYYRPITVQGL